MMAALPAELLAEKRVWEPRFVVISALPAVLLSVNDSRTPKEFVMIAVPAVLMPVNVVAPGVLLMTALPAVAALSNSSRPNALNVGRLDELLRMPAPPMTKAC